MSREYPNHHFPPPRWNPQFNDTEPAFVTQPWKDCCDKDEDCVCVTESDVSAWNTISSLSALTGVNFDDLSAYSAIATSSTLWNSNYDTVSANSAYWNSVSGLNQLSALNSAFWESASDIVSSNSARWNKAVRYSADISENADNISALSAAFQRNINKQFDPSTIDGDGTENSPYTVKNYQEYINLLNYYIKAVKPLYKNDQQNWLSLDATTDSDGINPYLKTLFNAINEKNNDQDVTLNNHGDLIQWIIKNLNVTGKTLQWEYVPSSTTANRNSVTALNEENVMYYYARPVNAYK